MKIEKTSAPTNPLPRKPVKLANPGFQSMLMKALTDQKETAAYRKGFLDGISVAQELQNAKGK